MNGILDDSLVKFFVFWEFVVCFFIVDNLFLICGYFTVLEKPSRRLVGNYMFLTCEDHQKRCFNLWNDFSFEFFHKIVDLEHIFGTNEPRIVFWVRIPMLIPFWLFKFNLEIIRWRNIIHNCGKFLEFVNLLLPIFAQVNLGSPKRKSVKLVGILGSKPQRGLAS